MGSLQWSVAGPWPEGGSRLTTFELAEAGPVVLSKFPMYILYQFFLFYLNRSIQSQDSSKTLARAAFISRNKNLK